MSHLTFIALALVASLLGLSFAIITPKTYGDWTSAGTNPFANTYAVQVHDSETDASGGCSQKVAVAGHGVFDVIELHCNTKIDLVQAADDKVNEDMIVGDRYFTDSPSSLTVVNEDHTCVERTYDISGENANVDSKDLSTVECQKIRKQMKTELTKMVQASGDGDLTKEVARNIDQLFRDLEDSSKESVAIANENNIEVNGSKDSNQDNSDGSTNSVDKGNEINMESEDKGYIVEISKPFFNSNGILVKNVNIESSAYNDVLEMPAFAKSYVITSHNKMLVGETLFSDKPDQLVVVAGPHSCSLREYGADGTTNSTELSAQGCVEVQREMREMAHRTFEGFNAADAAQRGRPGNIGAQMGSQVGNIISGILDVGSSGRPFSSGGFPNQNQPPRQPYDGQKRQGSQHSNQPRQRQRADRPSGILSPILSEISSPWIQMLNDIGDARRGSHARVDAPTFSFANPNGPQTNRQTSYSSQRADGEQGQFNLLGVLNPLTWAS